MMSVQRATGMERTHMVVRPCTLGHVQVRLYYAHLHHMGQVGG